MTMTTPTAPKIPGWTHVVSGKVRDVYTPEPNSAWGGRDVLLVVASDRISAYDFILPTPIPDKGKILTALSVWWFERMRDLVPTHLLSLDVPDVVAGRAMICQRLEMFPVECVVRGYLTGSGLAEYRESGRVCGITLPPGLSEASRLDTPIFTPAAKASMGDHDENVSFDRVVDMIGADDAARLRELSIAIYQRARDIGSERGVIVADTKFEFGSRVTDEGERVIVLGDEVLTPDSSRFWPSDEWVEGQVTPSFDKQFVRDWLTSPASGWDKRCGEEPPQLPAEVVDRTRQRYLQAYEQLTGSPLNI